MNAMLNLDALESVWNQNTGTGLIIADGVVLLGLSQCDARRFANDLLTAARVPDLARAMAAPEETPEFDRWTPATPINAVLREQYAR